MAKENQFETETYCREVTSLHMVLIGFTIAIILTLLILWLLCPTPWSGLAFIFLIGGILNILNVFRKANKPLIILTRDAFIQKELKAFVNWKDIDHVEFSPGKIRKILNIYYRKDHKIKKLRTLYASVENKEQLLASLKRFSTEYGFAFEET